MKRKTKRKNASREGGSFVAASRIVAGLKNAKALAKEINEPRPRSVFMSNLETAYRQSRMSRAVLIFLRREIRKSNFTMEEKSARLNLSSDYAKRFKSKRRKKT